MIPNPEENKPNETKSIILAIVVSVIFVFIYVFYNSFNQPVKKNNQNLENKKKIKQINNSPNELSITPQKEKQLTEKIVNISKKIKIKTPVIEGSIDTLGATINNLSLLKYYKTIDKKDNVNLLTDRKTNSYYHVSFGWQHGTNDNTILPTEETLWKTTNSQLSPKSPIQLTWTNTQNVKFIINISIDEKYMFKISQTIQNNSNSTIDVYPYSKISRKGIPHSNARISYVLFQGLLGYLNDELQQVNFNDATDQDEHIRLKSSNGGWVGITSKYWLVAAATDSKTPIYGSLSGNENSSLPYFQTDIISAKSFKIAPHQSNIYKSFIFSGPKDNSILSKYSETPTSDDNNLETNKYKLDIPNFNMAIDWGWYWFFTKPFFWLLHKLYSILGSMGLAILAVTLIVKTVMFFLAKKSYYSMNKMKELAPKIKEIQKQNGDDKVKSQQEVMSLYKREKVNPASGCLPILIQIPVFYSLYKVLYTSIELRHQPFFGWIQDMTAPDPTSLWNIFGLLPYNPASFGIPAMLILPAWAILYGVSMYLQQKMNPQPTDSTQAKIFTWMPVGLTFIMASFPAGLLIYWTWNNILTILQQLLIKYLHNRSQNKK